MSRESGDRLGERQTLVESLRRRGIRSESLLKAFLEVPRHLFVPEALKTRAYGEHALPIGAGQTISHPYTIAVAVEALELTGTERVLEVGTGSGYQTAILAHLAERVFSMERIPRLARAARARLERLGLDSVAIMVGDGSIGWARYAPYGAILVAAAAEEPPAPLLDQLTDGGCLVLPIGNDNAQVLCRFRRSRKGWGREELRPCSFVPLVGRVSPEARPPGRGT